MCNDGSLVQDSIKKSLDISVANGQKLTSDSLGKILVNPNVLLDNVLYVPNLSSNLISVNEITNL